MSAEVNHSVSVVGLRIGMDRFVLPSCVSLPTQAILRDPNVTNISVFGFDKAIRDRGVVGVLQDNDLVSGINGLSDNTTIVIQFSRTITVNDFVVLVEVNSPNSLSVQGALSSGSAIGFELRIEDGAFGAVPPGTSARYPVPADGPLMTRTVGEPHAVAFNLTDLGLASQSWAPTGIVIFDAFGLDFDVCCAGRRRTGMLGRCYWQQRARNVERDRIIITNYRCQ